MKVLYVTDDGRGKLPITRIKPSQNFLVEQKTYSSAGSFPPVVSTLRTNQSTTGKVVSPIQRPRWMCQICRKSLSSKRSYREHMNIHNDSRPFQCEHCDYAAASQMTLRRHVLRNHTSRQDWGYRCPYCRQLYMEPASYQQHIQSRHYGRSATFGCPYTLCSFVSKCFRHFREHLAKHEHCDSFEGCPDRLPYSFPDEDLKRYLIDDEYGVGFSKGNKSSSLRQKTVLYTNDRICRVDPPSRFHFDPQEDNEFMKEPIRLRVAPPQPRRVVHQFTPYNSMDDMPSLLEEQTILDDGSDWIEAEIEVPSNELMRLPDGQIELELD